MLVLKENTRGQIETFQMFEMIGKVGIGGWEYDKQVVVFMLCIHTAGYYSAIKKSEMMPFAAAWMGLEIILLNEVRQIPYDVTYMWNLKKLDI